jgi:hypothetical protein
MSKIKSISRVVAVAGAMAIAAQFAMVPAAFAKSPKCYAQPVAGSPGTYVWTCTTGRP